MCENASLFIFANNEKILQRIMMSRTGGLTMFDA